MLDISRFVPFLFTEHTVIPFILTNINKDFIMLEFCSRSTPKIMNVKGHTFVFVYICSRLDTIYINCPKYSYFHIFIYCSNFSSPSPTLTPVLEITPFPFSAVTKNTSSDKSVTVSITRGHVAWSLCLWGGGGRQWLRIPLATSPWR